MSEYHVQQSALSGRIWAGPLTPDKTAFKGKTDVTAEVMVAAAEHVLQTHGGSMWFTIDGHRYDVDVTKDAAP